MSRVAKCFAAFGRNFEFLTRKEMRLLFIGTATLFFFTFFSPARLSALFGWPDSRTPMGKWVDHSRARSSYCGMFGQYIYNFPRNIVEGTIKYEGEPSWGGERDWKIKGCPDRFEGLSFRFTLPQLSVVPRSEQFDRTFGAIIFLSQNTNSFYVRDMLQYYRSIEINPSLVSRFDSDTQLHYFDIAGVSRRRVFWGSDETLFGGLYMDCSIAVKVPQCSLHVISRTLDAHIAISFAMTNKSQWKTIVTGVENKINSFKLSHEKGS